MPGFKNVLVTGDVIIDHHIYKGERIITSSKWKTGSLVANPSGGARLICDLLLHLSEKILALKDKKKQNLKVDFGLNDISPEQGIPEAYAEWVLRDKGKAICTYCEEKTAEPELISWDLSEKLGYSDQCDQKIAYAKFARVLNSNHQFIIVDDGYLGFRDFTSHKAWPKEIKSNGNRCPWIIYKMSRPLAQGDLWKHVTESKTSSEKLVTIVSLDDLRREDVKISKGISWEQTAWDLVNELAHNPAISDLLHKSRHLIVLIGMEGALYVHNACNQDGREYRLLFDPKYMENEVEEESKRLIIGKMATFTAALTFALIQKKKTEFKNTDVEDAINVGLAAVRKLHKTGHLQKITHEKASKTIKKDPPAYPFETVADEILAPDCYFAKAFVPEPVENTLNNSEGQWTILENNYDSYRVTKNDDHVEIIARRVAMHGRHELLNVPSLEIGGFFTVDRSEIESLRIIRNLLLDYDREKSPKQPLSIAVFGPPGAGKNFAVEQIALFVLKQQRDSLLEFNLSQFSSPADLIAAFHQVRDKVLESKLPFVFWDEFDSENYRWLQYLLAPMQDGKFQEGQITHPIGKCVFIFAGGTSPNMEQFGVKEPEPRLDAQGQIIIDPDYQERLKAFLDFKLKKGPDFKSRLNGYLNVVGPNPREVIDPVPHLRRRDESDICYPIRRAVFLLSILGRNDRGLEMDWGLLRALLSVSKYTHGARSFAKILSHLKSQHRGRYVRSDLPPAAILAMHTDFADFIACLQVVADEELMRLGEKLAPRIHARWKETKAEKPAEYDREFNYLPMDLKLDNTDAGYKIKEILESFGYTIVPDHTDPDRLVNINNRLLRKDPDYVGLKDRLAEAEHKRWLQFREKYGWKLSKIRNDYRKLHPSMVPYTALPANEKAKDHRSVTAYATWLGSEGYRIIKMK